MKHSVPKKIVLIGASTGGPGVIQRIITALPKLNDATIIVAQHMVRGFIPSFAKRLQGYSKNPIFLIEDTQTFQTNNIYLCSGYTTLTKRDGYFTFTQKNSEDDAFNPDINLVFNSFVPLSQSAKILSVILTGIGDDGVDGSKNLSAHGAQTLTQNSSSAIVDGMPSRAREKIANIEVGDIEQIITKIKEFIGDV